MEPEGIAQLWHQLPEEEESDFALFSLWLECGCPPLGGWQKTHPGLERVAALSVSSLYHKSGRWQWRARGSAWLAWRRRVDQEAAKEVSHDWARRTSNLMDLYGELIASSLQTHLEQGTTLPAGELIKALKEFTVAGRLLGGQSTENHAHALTGAVEGASMDQLSDLHDLLTAMGK